VNWKRHPSRRRIAGASLVRGARVGPLGVGRLLGVTVIVAIAALVGVDAMAAGAVFALACLGKGFLEEIGREIAPDLARRLGSRMSPHSCPSWVKASGGGWVLVEPPSTTLLSQVDMAATDDKNGDAGSLR
jgi:hypothetical protein